MARGSAVGWLTWAVGLTLAALLTSNPLALGLLLVAALAAYIGAAGGSPPVALRWLAVVVSLVLLSVLVAAATGGYGRHVILDVPRLQLPSWLGGLFVGGPVTAEATADAAVRGLQIGAVLMAFVVLNRAVTPQQLLRAMPRALAALGLAASIGVTLLPSVVRAAREAREAELLRGRSLGRLRGWVAVVVPVTVGAVERSLQTAEALEVRGWGWDAPAHPGLRAAGLLTGVSLGGAAAFVATYWESGALPALGMAVVAAALIMLSLRSGGGRRTRLCSVRPRRWDALTLVAGVAGATAMVALHAADASVRWRASTGGWPQADPALLLPVACFAAAAVASAFAPPAPVVGIERPAAGRTYPRGASPREPAGGGGQAEVGRP